MLASWCWCLQGGVRRLDLQTLEKLYTELNSCYGRRLQLLEQRSKAGGGSGSKQETPRRKKRGREKFLLLPLVLQFPSDLLIGRTERQDFGSRIPAEYGRADLGLKDNSLISGTQNYRCISAFICQGLLFKS